MQTTVLLVITLIAISYLFLLRRYRTNSVRRKYQRKFHKVFTKNVGNNFTGAVVRYLKGNSIDQTAHDLIDYYAPSNCKQKAKQLKTLPWRDVTEEWSWELFLGWKDNADYKGKHVHICNPELEEYKKILISILRPLFLDNLDNIFIIHDMG